MEYRRRSISLPKLYDDLVIAFADERGLGFSPALVMMLEILRTDPRFAKSPPADKSAKADPEQTPNNTDPLVVMANTPFPPPIARDTLPSLSERRDHWATIRNIYNARRRLGMKISDVDYKRYTELARRAKEGTF